MLTFRGVAAHGMNICNKALEFDPEKRYQTPGAILADVQAALQKLESGQKEVAPLDGHNILEIDPEMAKEGLGKTVMVIESRRRTR